jgi:hypothetical protein
MSELADLLRQSNLQKHEKASDLFRKANIATLELVLDSVADFRIASRTTYITNHIYVLQRCMGVLPLQYLSEQVLLPLSNSQSNISTNHI